MDGTNSAGRTVSLLNDHEPPRLVRLSSFAPSVRSDASSYDSSPIGSPPTPQLIRSTSSDSTAMQSPSPITPDYAYDTSLESPVFSQSSFFPPQKESNSPYPHMAQVALPYHAAPPGYYVQQQEQLPPPPSSASAPAAAHGGVRPKKNSYPCPMAKTFHCRDYFTTSGHAARHAKKHTGKKDAFCPECNKAFTRKDNMEQHRRTHQSGRGSSKGSDRDAKRAKQKPNSRPSVSPLQKAQSDMMQSCSMVDPSLPVSPTGSYLSSIQPTESFVEFTQRSYPDPTAFAMTHGYNPASSYGGLDALAIAASGEKRKFDMDGEDE
ncbi:hypothetical protein GQ44DRAFT_767683 [Phaeosphaeriaceae sp. PMI808]|nr:hypothetical protein GQ44DRAFT_767683 [Phaeosphaeriaceae sp. PMI808]